MRTKVLDPERGLLRRSELNVGVLGLLRAPTARGVGRAINGWRCGVQSRLVGPSAASSSFAACAAARLR